MEILKRVTARFIAQKRAGDGSASSIIQQIITAQKLAGKLFDHIELVDALIAAGEKRRLGRISDIRVGPIKFDNSKVEATVVGTTGDYEVRITVEPTRGHHCTCIDWSKNGKQIGPCKHVLAVGIAWKTGTLEPAAKTVDDGLEAVNQSLSHFLV